MQKVIQHTSKLNILIGLTALVLSIALLSICKIPVTAQAETYGTAFSVEDETYLNVVIPNSVTLNITPTATGQFAKTSMDIDVNTNNATGYTLTMTADTTSLSRTSAVNGIDYSIPTLAATTTCTNESATTCDEFPVGYWGYKYTNAEVSDSSTYNPMTVAANPIRFLKEFKNTTDTTTITFGTKLSNSVPSGTYNGVNLTFIATTNYVIPSTVTYMQDFTAVIADSLTPGIAYTTKDSRDQEQYSVAKLADGNVWMLDNLRLGGTSAIALTSANTNTDTSINGGNFTLPATVDAARTFWGAYNDGNGWQKARIDSNHKNEIPSSSSPNDWKIGVYYNYCAASAGTSSCQNENATDQTPPTGDICPRGWRMPTGNYSGEWQKLINIYQNYESLVSELHMPLSGWRNNAGAASVNETAELWANGYLGASDDRRWRMYFGLNSSKIAIGAQERMIGQSVRCIFSNS